MDDSNDNTVAWDMNAVCKNITNCLHCLATACVWSRKENVCAEQTDERDVKWLTPGRLAKLCLDDDDQIKSNITTTTTLKCVHESFPKTPMDVHASPHPHDDWNNPVSLSLLLLLAVLIAANILYVIWKVSRHLLPKYRRRRRQRNLFPLSESDLGEVNVQRY